MIANPAIHRTVQFVLNRYFALDEDASSQLQALHGKVIEIQVRDLGLSLFLQINADGIVVMDHIDQRADTTLRGSTLALSQLGITGNRSQGLFTGEIEVEGDTELARQFKEILDHTEIDWEELLSKVLGDVGANQVGNWVRGVSFWGSSTISTLSSNVSEFLQEENNTLPRPGEVTHLLTGIDQLRTDVDRLQARIRRLQKKLPSDAGKEEA